MCLGDMKGDVMPPEISSNELLELIELLRDDKRERETYREWRTNVTTRLEELSCQVQMLQQEAGARKLLMNMISVAAVIGAAVATVWSVFIRPFVAAGHR